VSTDWIKMRVDLRTHPKVVRMASALRADRLRVIGGLFAVWSIFDAHSSDGVLDGYTFHAIDDDLGWKGFAQAMSGVDWLVDQEGRGLSAPRFEEHNGQSAKRRAMETERKRLEREAEKSTKVGQMSASDADKSVTREEKRREEEKEIPQTPKGAKPPIGLKAWLDVLKAKGEKPIPEDDPVFAYAADAKIPTEFLRLAWLEFRHQYTQPNAKRYRDWRAHFRGSVRKNWQKLWYLNGDGYQLTTAGIQAQRVHQERVAA
jgi:hypothetical protein